MYITHVCLPNVCYQLVAAGFCQRPLACPAPQRLQLRYRPVRSPTGVMLCSSQETCAGKSMIGLETSRWNVRMKTAGPRLAAACLDWAHTSALLCPL